MPHTPSQPRLAYTCTGPTGAPVVVLVGGVGSVQAAWLLQVKALSRALQVVTYDHRGTGDSEVLDAPATMRDFAADLVGLLDHLGVAKASFVGLSFGGRVLQTLALDWPARVDRLILGGTSCGPSHGHAGDAAALAAMRAIDGLDEDGWAERVLPALFGPRYRARYPERVRNLARWRARHPVDPVGLSRQWEAHAAFDACDRLGEIGAPTLIVHGQDDALSPVANAHLLAARIPGARLAVLDGVGHSPNVEDPERFNQLILDFLSPGAPG